MMGLDDKTPPLGTKQQSKLYSFSVAWSMEDSSHEAVRTISMPHPLTKIQDCHFFFSATDTTSCFFDSFLTTMKLTLQTTTAWLVLAATSLIDHGCHGQSNQTETPVSNPTETEKPQDAGGLLYLDAPVQEWETTIPAVRPGNGVFVSPDDALIVATSGDASLSAFDRLGTPLWTYGPPLTDSASEITCSSGITFAPDYLTYAVIVGEDSGEPAL
jgi:hypothetical protein